MADRKLTDEERLARAIEAFEFGSKVSDPEAAMRILNEAEQRRSPGDPFSASMDQLVDYMFAHPELLQSTEPSDHLRGYLRLVTDQVKEMVAEKQDEPALMQAGTLDIEIDDDWQINAFVESDPPYSIYVSTNLFLYCAKVSELLVTGLGLDIVDDDQEKTDFQAAPPRSVAEVARDVKKVIESFIADQTIPSIEVPMKAAHYMFHQIIFHSVMSFIVCHEFGHLVINDCRHRGRPVPFADLAHDQLQGNIENLIWAGTHDPEDLAGLRRLDEKGLQRVLQTWANEINADLIGTSLAAEYADRRGPWKGGPGIVGLAYLAIHLCFIAQYFLQIYLNRQRPDHVLVSKTHPPIDFRMHCVLDWMYGGAARADGERTPYDENKAYKAITEYSQRVLGEILA